MKLKALLFGLVLPLASFAWQASAASVDVTYTVTGSPGDWTYDFSIENNLGGSLDIFGFDVSISGGDYSSYPAGWVPTYPISLRGLQYCYVSCSHFGGLPPAETQSGFDFTDSSTIAKTSINWGIAAVQTDPFDNPVFNGVAMATPELSTWLLMLIGFAGLGFAGYRRARSGRTLAT